MSVYFAGAGAIAAAIIWTRSKSWIGVLAGALALAAAWTIGEREALLFVADRTASLGFAGIFTPVAGRAGIALVLGFVVPGWAGSFVGRRVTRGTGWLSAGVVAATAVGAANSIATSLAGRL